MIFFMKARERKTVSHGPILKKLIMILYQYNTNANTLKLNSSTKPILAIHQDIECKVDHDFMHQKANMCIWIESSNILESTFWMYIVYSGMQRSSSHMKRIIKKDIVRA